MKRIVTITLIVMQAFSLFGVGPETIAKINKEAALKPKESALDVLPNDVKGIIIQMVGTARTLDDTLAGVKRFYIASPKSRADVGITSAILRYLRQRYGFQSSKQLQEVVDKLKKLENFPVFKNEAMQKWIEQEKQNIDKEEELRLAAQGENVKKVNELIAQGVDINAGDIHGVTALMWASGNDRSENVKILLEAGAKVNEKSKDGNTALIWSAVSGYTKVMELLLKAGARINEKNNDGFTALMRASRNGYIEAVNLLLAANANVNEKDDDGVSALMWATFHHHRAVVKRLLAAGANVNEKNQSGQTVLMIASRDGLTEVVQWFLAEGANVDEKSMSGLTALKLAGSGGHTEIVELLENAKKAK